MIKKKIKVIIEKEIEIELKNTLGALTESEFLEEWRKGLWPVESIDDVYMHAAEMAAHGFAECNMDGLGKLSLHKGDTIFKLLSEETGSEIID